MGTVMYSVHRIGSVLGKRVVVVGAGPIGLCFTDLMVRHGARQVIVTDVHEYRLDTARQIGATHTINAAREDVRERVSAITDGEMADVSIEACGLSETYQQVFDVLRKQGTVAIFGIPHLEDTFSLQWDSVYSKLPNIIVTNSAQAGERIELGGALRGSRRTQATGPVLSGDASLQLGRGTGCVRHLQRQEGRRVEVPDSRERLNERQQPHPAAGAGGAHRGARDRRRDGFACC